ncbi:hypothetical protein [Thermomonas flagellata]|uniref:hypothetical protein n=1 Tax=Thermomonas flagellata TaxID=2888524 RepID=UPI001F03AE98|nr:hypothetical protein [Thermomonas flagellata]
MFGMLFQWIGYMLTMAGVLLALLLVARFDAWWWAAALVLLIVGGSIAVGIGAGLGKPWALKAYRWLTWHRRHGAQNDEADDAP